LTSPPATSRIVLGIQYHGGSWHGWQTQPDGHTVQDQLQAALKKFTRHDIVVTCAGRTDSGVHAIEQVIHFDSPVVRSLSSWVRGLNASLPSSISVRWAHALPGPVPLDSTLAGEANTALAGTSPVGRLLNQDHDLDLDLDKDKDHDHDHGQNQEGQGAITTMQENGLFHARFSATARQYRYLLYNHPVRSPLLDGRAGWAFRHLDESAMAAGAAHLVGTHDFSAFRAIECQAKSPVRSMSRLTVERHGDMIVFDLAANAFLHHMVRNIVGSLVYVGQGRQSPEWMAELLLSRQRSLAAPTFMPDGLYLARVDYDEKWGLPQQPWPDKARLL
jgi:tRNA pseudouridine38-40 synthase